MFKMEKRAQRKPNLQFNKNVPGCFWRVFNAIDYHPWHNVKKMLPYRKHSRSKGSPKSTLNNSHVAEVPEQINDENKTLVCTAESCSLQQRSEEAHVTEVVTKEMSEEESQMYQKLNSNSKRRLSRTDSIHHLEPSYDYLGNNSIIGDSRVTPQQKTAMKLTASGLESNSLNAMDTDYFFQRKVAIDSTSVTEKSNGVKKTLETNQVNRNISNRSFKGDVHIQEIFKANRILFAELLQGARGNHTLRTPKIMKSSASLAKSRSFPAPALALAPKGYKKLSSLQHKQIESFPKGQRSVSVPQPSKLVEFESPTNFHEGTTPCDSNSTSYHHNEQQTSSSSLGPNRGLKHGGWNQLVIKRFSFIKQKIRHSFTERKKGNNQNIARRIPTVDPSADKLPLDREEAQESSGITSSEGGSGIRGYSETDSSENDQLGNRVQSKTRTASLNVSLEIYSQLSESGFDKNREAKSYHSQSIKLTSGDKILISEKPQKSFGRNLSMPDIALFCTLFTEPHGVFRTETQKRGLVHSNTDNDIQTDENPAHLLKTDISELLDIASQSMIEKGDQNMLVDHSGSLNGVESHEATAWADELEEKISHLDISVSKHQVLASECIVEDVSELLHTNRALKLETCFQDDETLKLSNSEGAILNPWCSFANELESLDDQPSEASIEALPAFETIFNHEIIDDSEKISLSFLLHSELDRINNADFNYLRYVLQLSSFIESGHIIDQPLSSLILEGEEALFYKKLECYWEKIDKDFDHELLLDLVYETLHDVFEKSFICFLKTFSLKSQLCPMPLGQYILEDVREKVAWYLCLGPELDQSLDDVVGRDLSKGDDWMNLQSETEYIALELEDLILDELLDEVLSF